MKGKINIQPIPESRLKKGYPAYFYEKGYLNESIEDIKDGMLIFDNGKRKYPISEASEFIFIHDDKVYPLAPHQWIECADNDWYEDRNHELQFKINKDGFAEVISEAIEMGVTQRGFSLGEFEDDYRQKCTIQMSSVATRRCIWLGVSNMGPLLEGPDGSKNYDINARMHLTREHVRRLLPLLTKFAETGDL